MLRWRIALLISAAIAISYLDRQTLPVAIGAIKEDIPISNQVKAFLDSAFLVTYGLMYLGGGRLMDLLGTRRGFTVIMIFWSLACASHGFAANVVMLAASRLLLGVGEGGGFPAATRAIAEWFPVKERSQAEIGEILGCSAKAVETRIYRARQQLRSTPAKLQATAGLRPSAELPMDVLKAQSVVRRGRLGKRHCWRRTK